MTNTISLRTGNGFDFLPATQDRRQVVEVLSGVAVGLDYRGDGCRRPTVVGRVVASFNDDCTAYYGKPTGLDLEALLGETVATSNVLYEDESGKVHIGDTAGGAPDLGRDRHQAVLVYRSNGRLLLDVHAGNLSGMPRCFTFVVLSLEEVKQAIAESEAEEDRKYATRRAAKSQAQSLNSAGL